MPPDPDLLSAVVEAVSAGAVAAVKDTAADAVKDAYAALRTLLTGRDVDVSGVERRPDSRAKQDSLREDLADGDAVDDELLAAARAVVDAVAAHDAPAAAGVGVDLERVRAQFLRVHDVDATGTGVRVRDADVAGGIEIGGVRAGPTREDPDPPGR